MQASIYDGMTDSEKEVANYLQQLKIWWQYEQPVYVQDEKKRPRVWSPDFYLPELGIYIEVCGSKNFDYDYREGIYKKNRIPVVFIHKYKEKNNWQFYLRKRISEIHAYRESIVKKLLDKI